MSPFAYLPEHVVVAWPSLSPKAKAVAVALASFMARDGKAWPSVAALGERAGVTRRKSVTEALAELRKAGLIQVTRGGWHRANVYTWATSDRAESALSDTPKTGRKVPFRQGGKCPSDRAENALRKDIIEGDHEGAGGGGVSDGAEAATPEGLAGLALYEQDCTLCRRWPELLAAWEAAYPELDVEAEIAKAHAWEVANPARRKKDRAKFLGAWLGRAKPTELDAAAAQRQAEADAASYAYANSGTEERLAAEGKL